MNKDDIRQQIMAHLEADRDLLLKAARDAHAAATDPESIAEDKYDTRGLEASYIAQGQANRAQEIRQALELYRNLRLQSFTADDPIRLTALVRLEDADGGVRIVFLGPAAGGMTVEVHGECVMVITPASPLGRELLGKVGGDEVVVQGGVVREYEIVAVW